LQIRDALDPAGFHFVSDDELAGMLYDAYRVHPSLTWAAIRNRQVVTDRQDDTNLFLTRWRKVAQTARRALRKEEP
jgi:hypothetical protein